MREESKAPPTILSNSGMPSSVNPANPDVLTLLLGVERVLVVCGTWAVELNQNDGKTSEVANILHAEIWKTNLLARAHGLGRGLVLGVEDAIVAFELVGEGLADKMLDCTAVWCSKRSPNELDPKLLAESPAIVVAFRNGS